MTYQDLLTEVIEPIIGNHIPNQEDEIRIKDYIKCLSIPALDEGINNEKTKTIIMAMSSKETKLLMDFWNNNEELIKACLSAIASNEEFSDEARKIASQASTTNFHRDVTKYKIGANSDKEESRSSLVPAYIKKWAYKKGLDKMAMIDDVMTALTEAFPSTLRGGKNSREDIVYKNQPNSDYKERNYPEIKIGNHSIYVSANIWTKDRFANFIDNAAKLAGNDSELEIIQVLR